MTDEPEETIELETAPPLPAPEDAPYEEYEGDPIDGDEFPMIGIKEAELHAAKTPITVDGVMDEAYKTGGTLLHLNHYTKFMEDHGGVVSADAWLTYDKDYLYAYIRVEDHDMDESATEVYNMDSISIILDFARNTQKTTSGSDEPTLGYVTVAFNGLTAQYHMYAKMSYESIGVWCDTGYIVEVKLPFLKDFKGQDIGLEIAAADLTAGMKVGNYTWNEHGDEMWHYSHVCGTAKFVDDLWS